ncbi:MAG: S8 family serine peptidase [Ignavibacteriaceae bacterium]
MKKIVILSLFLLASVSYAQTKYFIYFKDKGINKNQTLSKSSVVYNEAVSSLSERSIERRKKSMGDNFITYEDLPVRKDYISGLNSLGVKIVWKLKWFNAVSAYLTDVQKDQVLKLSYVNKVIMVKTITYKRINNNISSTSIYKSSAINGFNYGPSYTQDELIKIPEVQAEGINGDGVIIGLLDSGFRWKTHESLEARKVIAEYDFVFDDSVTSNQPGDLPAQDTHGTNVFSIIGGFKQGEIIGPAFNSSYVLAKTEDERSESHIEEDNYARALIWMDSLGVDITSSSLGYNQFDKPAENYTYADMNGKTAIVTKAAEMAFQRGILTMTSAGNEGNQKWHYIVAPADGFNTIAVGAVNNENIVAGFSSRGPTFDGRIKPDVVAQGVDVYHADPYDSAAYSSGEGTSYAAPLASGTAALLLSAYPFLTNVQARDILLRTAGNFYSPNNDRGYGLVSATKAISFPNLENISGEYFLHKIFLNHNKINPSSVVLNYTVEGSGANQLNMNYDGKLKYNVSFPAFSNGVKVEFYFTFTDSSGKNFREPANVNYYFNYGDLIVKTLNDISTELPFIDDVLDQNRPNPFSGITKIRFNSAGNENAQIIIYNILGKKVKELFNSISQAGINTVYWDGTTSAGVQAASGIYIYTLNLNGKFYSRKMMYLK